MGTPPEKKKCWCEVSIGKAMAVQPVEEPSEALPALERYLAAGRRSSIAGV